MIYFDNAATTLPKPPEVRQAVLKATEAGNPGRGGHKKAMEGARLLFSARSAVASHFGAPGPENVCFFYNATTALNVVIKTLAPGGGLIISDLEHNAVRRPALAVEGQGAELAVFHACADEQTVCRSFEERIGKKTKLAVFLHTSNVCPAALPVKKLTAIARRRGVLTVIDCAQAGGHLPLGLEELGADGLVLPSHKGLFGIAGAGMLIASARLKAALESAPTVMEGGSGVFSFEPGMPASLPERLEWGTPALPAIASVAAGISFIEGIGYEKIAAHEKELLARAVDRLRSIKGVSLHGAEALRVGGPQPGMPLLFTVEGFDGALLCAELSDLGICLREGFHCAPLAHETIGTARTGGLRLGFSLYNTTGEIDLFAKELKRIVER